MTGSGGNLKHRKKVLNDEESKELWARIIDSTVEKKNCQASDETATVHLDKNPMWHKN